jgi:DNA-binding beta-propeller fold protein YncE
VRKVAAQSNSGQLLRLEKTIPLPDVKGRIDHLSVDVKGPRLFVAALGNNTVEVIDLKVARRTNSIKGLEEPQGILYVASANRLYVANRKDGSLRIYDGGSLKLMKSIAYGGDADNVRFEGATNHVFVGMGTARWEKLI